MTPEPVRIAFSVQGQAQGVGFRPFVWRLARSENLSGFCRNTSAGVLIEVQGPEISLANFESRLLAELPPLARITALEKKGIAPVTGEKDFEIRASEAHAGQNVLVSPDVAVCDACLDDIRDPRNPRFGYAFTNCVNCGPRYSITRKIPYDRPATTMACFELCEACASEYADPRNRRFHAQPLACPQCGPKIWHVPSGDASKTAPSPENSADALAKAGRDLKAGKIVAIRGLGGFQLACDARNRAAVEELRRRKTRPHKALALMAGDLETCAEICFIDDAQKEILAGRRKPITLCEARSDVEIGAWLWPDCRKAGLMLPYTPLHALLFDWLSKEGVTSPLLVMTSANPAGEPICLGNREALTQLKRLADSWLLHDRDILCRVDDSVVDAAGKAPVFLRRGRGYTPEPLELGAQGPCVFGAGADLKAAFCLTRGERAFIGQHIGDLASPASLDFYEEALAHLQNLLEVRPELAVCDLHPDFHSTRLAKDFAAKNSVPCLELQHHAAHAAACLAENNIYEPCLALCLDGSGLGTDGEIWGGELLFMNLAEPDWKRLGAFSSFPLPGGEAAIREPWRIAEGLNWTLGKGARPQIDAMLERGINCPKTTSCGRLFDAIAAALGICREISYEGQAAIRLEKLGSQWLAANPEPAPLEIAPFFENGLWRLDSARIFSEITAIGDPGEAAASFHSSLANGLAQMATQAANREKIAKIALSGGATQNGLLRRILSRRLEQAGLQVLYHRVAPPGDGGICLGQAVWGRQILARQI